MYLVFQSVRFQKEAIIQPSIVYCSARYICSMRGFFDNDKNRRAKSKCLMKYHKPVFATKTMAVLEH